MDAISISDLHLGSDACQVKKLEVFLENIENRTRKLILNGDVFDSLNFSKLKKHHWHILSKIRKYPRKWRQENFFLYGDHFDIYC